MADWSCSKASREGVAYQEVIVESTMLKVMCDGRPVGGIHFQHAHGIAFPDAAMSQQHVCHLKH